MRLLHNFHGFAIRLTEERRAHILEHPEMATLESAIEEALLRPEKVVRSFHDPDANLYYRFLHHTQVGEKYLCVVVKTLKADAFVLTAYLTDHIKKGVPLWPTPQRE